jgi:hypothetical protein
MQAKVTQEQAACLVAGRSLARSVWNAWKSNSVPPELAATAIVYLVEEILDGFPSLRQSVRVGLQAAIDQERAP